VDTGDAPTAQADKGVPVRLRQRAAASARQHRHAVTRKVIVLVDPQPHRHRFIEEVDRRGKRFYACRCGATKAGPE
jgi:hypothetical protein